MQTNIVAIAATHIRRRVVALPVPTAETEDLDLSEMNIRSTHYKQVLPRAFTYRLEHTIRSQACHLGTQLQPCWHVFFIQCGNV